MPDVAFGIVEGGNSSICSSSRLCSQVSVIFCMWSEPLQYRLSFERSLVPQPQRPDVIYMLTACRSYMALTCESPGED